jgi:hypothetical protein
MTNAEVEMTLSMLKGAVWEVRNNGKEVDSVRIGCRLCDAIIAYNESMMNMFRGGLMLREIMGIPVRTDYVNPWVLKVLTAVDVPVMRESEVAE